MQNQTLLGYDEQPKELDGEYDYVARSYIFRPIYEAGRGSITTAAFRLCRECHGAISASGGPGIRSVCLICYPIVQLQDFNSGYSHVIQHRT